MKAINGINLILVSDTFYQAIICSSHTPLEICNTLVGNTSFALSIQHTYKESPFAHKYNKGGKRKHLIHVSKDFYDAIEVTRQICTKTTHLSICDAFLSYGEMAEFIHKTVKKLYKPNNIKKVCLRQMPEELRNQICSPKQKSML